MTGIEGILIAFAKESVFIALFLYLLIWKMPRMEQRFDEKMEQMDKKHDEELQDMKNEHRQEITKLEQSSTHRENELMRLLDFFGKQINEKLNEVLRKVDK